MVDLNRSDPLFDAQFPVRIRDRSLKNTSGRRNDFGEDESLRYLTIRLLTGSRHSNNNSSSSIRERLLHIEITDEQEPYFLYTLDVGEDDFHELKKDQALLVDFDAFPKKFIELLENCVNCADEATCVLSSHQLSNNNSRSPTTPSAETTNQLSSLHSSQHQSLPKFLARLETSSFGGGGGGGGGGGWDSALLSMVETNPFKQLTHLSLQFRPGNDSSIKLYLAGRLNQMLNKTKELSNLLSETEKRLDKETSARLAAASELASIHQERATELREINSAHATELATRRDEFAKDRELAISKLEEARSVQQQVLENALESLRKRLDDSENKNSSLTELKYKHEAELKDLRSKNEAIEKQHESCVKELKTLREQSTKNETNCFNLTVEVQKLSLKCAAFEQQVIDKEVLIKQGAELSQQSDTSRRQAEAELSRYKNAISSLQDKLKTSASEIHKGNDIISRLQAENKTLKDKSAMKSDVIREQERILSEERSKVAQSASASHADQLDKERLAEKLEKSKAENNELRRKVKESAELLESNQQTIAWLNKELNASIGGGGGGGGLSGINTTSSSGRSVSNFSVNPVHGASSHSSAASTTNYSSNHPVPTSNHNNEENIPVNNNVSRGEGGVGLSSQYKSLSSTLPRQQKEGSSTNASNINATLSETNYSHYNTNYEDDTNYVKSKMASPYNSSRSNNHVDLSGVKSWAMPLITPQHDGLSDIHSNWQSGMTYQQSSSATSARTSPQKK